MSRKLESTGGAQKEINHSVRYSLRIVVILVFSTFSSPILTILLGSTLCNSNGTHIHFPALLCFSSAYSVQFAFALIFSIIHILVSTSLNMFLPPLHPKHRGIFSTSSLPLPASMFAFLMGFTTLTFYSTSEMLIHPIFLLCGSGIILTMLFAFPPFYSRYTNVAFAGSTSLVFVVAVFSLIASLSVDSQQHRSMMNHSARIVYWILFLVFAVSIPFVFAFLMRKRLISQFLAKRPHYIIPQFKHKENRPAKKDFAQVSDAFDETEHDSEESIDAPVRKFTSARGVERSLRFIFEKPVRHSERHISFVSSAYDHALEQFPSSTTLVMKAALYEISFPKDYAKATALLQQAILRFPYFFDQWTYFSISQELDGMSVSRDETKGMDELWKGLGTGAVSSDQFSRVESNLNSILALTQAMWNLLRKSTFSLDRVHHFALAAVDKALVTHHEIQRMLLEHPNSVQLWKMMQKLQMEVFNDADANESMQDAIDKLELKESVKARDGKNKLSPDDEKALQYSLTTKNVSNMIQQFLIKKNKPRSSMLCVFLIIAAAITIVVPSVLFIVYLVIDSAASQRLDMFDSLGKVSFVLMNTLMCVRDIYEYNLDPTVESTNAYIQPLEWLNTTIAENSARVNKLTTSTILTNTGDLSLWSARDPSLFGGLDGFVVYVPTIPAVGQPLLTFSHYVGLLDVIGDFSSALSTIGQLLTHTDVFTNPDRVEALRRETEYTLVNGPLQIIEPIKHSMRILTEKTLAISKAFHISTIACSVALEILTGAVFASLIVKQRSLKKERRASIFGLVTMKKEVVSQRLHRSSDEEEEEDIHIPAVTDIHTLLIPPSTRTPFLCRVESQGHVSAEDQKSVQIAPKSDETNQPKEEIAPIARMETAETTGCPLDNSSTETKVSTPLSNSVRKDSETASDPNNPDDKDEDKEEGKDENNEEGKDENNGEDNNDKYDDLDVSDDELLRIRKRRERRKRMKKRFAESTTSLLTISPTQTPLIFQPIPTNQNGPHSTVQNTSNPTTPPSFSLQRFTPTLNNNGLPTLDNLLTFTNRTPLLSSTNTPLTSVMPSERSTDFLINPHREEIETRELTWMDLYLDQRINEHIIDSTLTNQQVEIHLEDVGALKGIMKRSFVGCMIAGPLFIVASILLIFFPFFLGTEVIPDAVQHTFTVVVRNAVMMQLVFLEQQLVYSDSPTLVQNEPFQLATNPVWNTTSHLVSDQSQLLQLIEGEMAYLTELNNLANFGSVFFDSGHAITDTAFSSFVIPRSRGLFPALDAFSTNAKDCFLIDGDCDENRFPQILGTFVGLDNIFTWLITATTKLIRTDAADLTPDNVNFGIAYKLMMLDGKDGYDTYLDMAVDGHHSRLQSTRTGVITCYIVGFVLVVLTLFVFVIPPFRELDRLHKTNILLFHLVGWKARDKHKVSGTDSNFKVEEIKTPLDDLYDSELDEELMFDPG
ncbi:hypothetical protein BLNAU_5663 [Blattamonas nauphoetae]|uniref:Uncharacterized protein n=1 Tax=Blattamonas nauphoetae TaxID=2049346 RepID=A0ABQ9Y6N9_9EUKA|nr:hypothetical protein BLNAU_5663 [Blattamonas nauphoetae]